MRQTTNNDNLTLRWATPQDTPFVAWGICCALHREPDETFLQFVASICQRDDVLYSYKHTLLACLDGNPVGLCLCYDGAQYHEMRIRTFALFQSADSDDASEGDDLDLEHMEDESGPGEYYIDSLAVKPAFRGRGIARQLMNAQIAHGRSLDLECTLLVDPDNPDALRLYKDLGFVYTSDCYAFGQIFWKMTYRSGSDLSST